MKRLMKSISAVVMVALIFLATINMPQNVTVSKADATQAVVNAKTAVVEVSVNYVDKSNKSHLIQMGSGFLIGNDAASGAQYIHPYSPVAISCHNK